ncbi:hypothetical protein AMECASPLE_027877, partial [Ameca splendens]
KPGTNLHLTTPQSSAPDATMSSSFFILLLLPLISAQSFHYGSCPTPAVQPDFDLQEYMGTCTREDLFLL